MAKEGIEAASGPMVMQISPTGIPRLDFLLRGGIPRGQIVVLGGTSGTGKTILSMQWLFCGYKKYNEPGIYLTSTEPVAKAIENLKGFAFFNQSYINPLRIHMTDIRTIINDLGIDPTHDLTYNDNQKILQVIQNLVTGSGAKRLVIDSITGICYRLKYKEVIRKNI